LTDPRSLPLTDQGKHTHLNRTCHKIICRKIIAPLVNRQYVDHRWDTLGLEIGEYYTRRTRRDIFA
jgi:hypothetical protein